MAKIVSIKSISLNGDTAFEMIDSNGDIVTVTKNGKGTYDAFNEASNFQEDNKTIVTKCQLLDQILVAYDEMQAKNQDKEWRTLPTASVVGEGVALYIARFWDEISEKTFKDMFKHLSERTIIYAYSVNEWIVRSNDIAEFPIMKALKFIDKHYDRYSDVDVKNGAAIIYSYLKHGDKH